MSSLQLNIQMSIVMLGFLQGPLIFIPGITIGKSKLFHRITVILYELLVLTITGSCFYYFQYIK